MVISSREQGEDGSLSAEVRVPKGAAWFDGHFPGYPVLPGIAQLGMVYEIVRNSLHSPVRVAEVNNIRFKQMIAPDDCLVVKAELRPGDGRYAFRITRDDEVVCTGSMTFVNT
jgi:3-hydroxymyristoyl/3-hydroxydecanoyl-(acyl carrier protein) dehydratase